MLEQTTRETVIAALEADHRLEISKLAEKMLVPMVDVWCLYQLIERRKNPDYKPKLKTSTVLHQLRLHPSYSDTRIAKIVGCNSSHVSNVRLLLKYLRDDPITAPHYGSAKRKIESAPMYGVPQSELESNPIYRAPQPEPEPDIVTQVLAERGKDYGDYAGKAQFIQGVKYLMRTSPSWEAMDADMRESMEMIAHKMGRTLYGNPAHKDNFLDIAGYAKLVADRL